MCAELLFINILVHDSRNLICGHLPKDVCLAVHQPGICIIAQLLRFENDMSIDHPNT